MYGSKSHDQGTAGFGRWLVLFSRVPFWVPIFDPLPYESLFLGPANMDGFKGYPPKKADPYGQTCVLFPLDRTSTKGQKLTPMAHVLICEWFIMSESQKV